MSDEATATRESIDWEATAEMWKRRADDLRAQLDGAAIDGCREMLHQWRIHGYGDMYSWCTQWATSSEFRAEVTD